MYQPFTQCHSCLVFRNRPLFNPIIGYGLENRVTRVDENVRCCGECIDNGSALTTRAIGQVIGWELVVGGYEATRYERHTIDPCKRADR